MIPGKIIAIVNQKGGVGKTTTAINVSASLAHYGEMCLLIDLDPQANSTSGLGFDKNNLNQHIYHVLLGQTSLSSIIKKTTVEKLYLAPSNINLIGAELELVNIENRELKLYQALNELQDNYKYIFIDCPPSLGLLTVNALTVADSVLIPIQCEYFALEGLSQLLKTIELIQNNINIKLTVEGVLLTMYDSRVNLSGQVIEEIKKHFGEKVFQSIIPRNIRLAEAPSYGKPALVYDKASRGAQIYLDLANEIMEINQSWERGEIIHPAAESKVEEQKEENITTVPSS